MTMRVFLSVAALLLSACGTDAHTSTAGATTSLDATDRPEAPITTADEPISADTTGTSELSLAPTELALADDDLLCIAIDRMLDDLVLGNTNSKSDYEVVEQHLPLDLRIQSPADPTSAQAIPGFDRAAAVDAHTIVECGVPFFQSTLHASLTCAPTGQDDRMLEYMSDWGPCTDPRLAPRSMLPLDLQMAELEKLGQAVRSEFERIDNTLDGSSQ